MNLRKKVLVRANKNLQILFQIFSSLSLIFLVLLGFGACQQAINSALTPAPVQTTEPLPSTSPAPIIASISPAFGPTTGSTLVTILGVGFTPTTQITFTLNTPVVTPPVTPTCSIVSTPTDTSFTCMTSPSQWGFYTVTVTNPDGQTATLVNGFTYSAPAPTVVQLGSIPCPGPTPSPSPWDACPACAIFPTSVSASPSPAIGSVMPASTPIAITGNNFLTGVTVTVGGVPCPSPSITSFLDTRCVQQVTCTPVPIATGTVSVIVTNPDNQTVTIGNGLRFQ